MPRSFDRRELLKGIGIASTVGVAGCLGGNGNGGSGDSGGDSGGDDSTDGDSSGGDSSGGDSGSDEGQTLTVSEFLPENHPGAVYGIQKFKELIEERTNLTLDVYYSSQLGASDNQVNLVQGGTADIASTLPGYESDVLPLSNVGTIPGTYSDVMAAEERYYNLVTETFREPEYEPLGLRPIMGAITTPYQLATIDTQLTSQDDWSGLTVRTSGGTNSVAVESLGGTPAELGGDETYQALERGTVNGASFALANMYSRDLHDHVSYCTTNINMGSFAAVYSMNLDVFNSLSEENQQAIVEAGREASLNFTEGQVTEDEDAVDEMSSAGVEMYEVDSDERDSWNQTMLEASREVWLDQVDNENAEQYLEEFTG